MRLILKMTLLFFSPLLFLGTSLTAKAESYLLACSEWPPFLSAKLPHGGVYTHILMESAKRAKMDIRLEYYPWQRVIKQAKAGKISGVACPSYSEERTSWMAYVPEVFLHQADGFFVRSDTQLAYENLSELADLKIGVLKGGSAYDYLNKQSQNSLSLQTFPNEASGLRMLAGKRFDAVYLGRTDGLSLLENDLTSLKGEIIYVRDVKAKDYMPGFSRAAHPNAEDLAIQLGKGFAEIRADGTLDKIYQTHKFVP